MRRSDDEAGRFSHLFRIYINDNQKIYRAYQRGAIEEEAWRDFAAQAAALVESPGGRLFMEGHANVHADYQQAIRKHLSEKTKIDLSLGREKIRRESNAISNN